MEYISGAQTMDAFSPKSEEYRIELVSPVLVYQSSEYSDIAQVRNARHVVRALQYGDVSQHDFHREQVMVLDTPVPHIVMFDFASASTSTEPENHEHSDYSSMLSLLVESKLNEGQDVAAFLSHFGEPEVWDRVMSSGPPDGRGRRTWISAPDPFAWVYSNQM